MQQQKWFTLSMGPCGEVSMNESEQDFDQYWSSKDTLGTMVIVLVSSRKKDIFSFVSLFVEVHFVFVGECIVIALESVNRAARIG